MKTLIIVLSALTISSLSSCKKQYSCSCTTTFSVSGSGSATETTTDTYSEKMKEKQAKAACDETEAKLKKANEGHASDVEYFTSANTTVSTICDVK